MKVVGEKRQIIQEVVIIRLLVDFLNVRVYVGKLRYYIFKVERKQLLILIFVFYKNFYLSVENCEVIFVNEY